jgi:uncharacterized protein YgiM (DUF1202 family)
VSAAARPTATPASIRPDASRASATPPVVYVRNQTANLREGAGVSYRVLGTAPRGSQLPVVGEAGPEQNKWFKVELADGREVWVASSAIGSNP